MILVVEPDDHRGEHYDPVLAKFSDDFCNRSPLLLGVARARAFVSNPEAVNTHLQYFFDFVLANGFDTREGEDGKLVPALDDAIAKFHGPLLVEQEIFV